MTSWEYLGLLTYDANRLLLYVTAPVHVALFHNVTMLLIMAMIIDALTMYNDRNCSLLQTPLDGARLHA